jgi:hypothetical protein
MGNAWDIYLLANNAVYVFVAWVLLNRNHSTTKL